MLQVSFNSATAFLLDDQPNWDTAFQVEATIPAMYERGLTGRETRRAMGDTLRLTCKFTCVLSSSAAITAVRNSLQALADQNVLCPFWPGVFAAGATPPVTAAYYALFNADGSYNSIQPTSALPFSLAAAPLMVGILGDKMEPQMHSPGIAMVEYQFAENGNYPLTPATFTAPTGLTASGGAGTRPLFPFLPDWSTLPKSVASEQDVTRRQIGALRTLATAYYTQRGRRTVEQSFTLVNADAFNLLRFFSDMGGEQNNFWLGACVNEANLAATLHAADTSMTVDNGAALGTNAFVLISDGAQRLPLVVSSVAGNVWNLSAAPGATFNVGMASIESLVLARFDTLKLQINFQSPTLASCMVRFKELPWETNAVAGETYGTTMGALPVTASFFQFTMTTPSGASTWYFTSYERNLSDGTNTWLSAPIEYDEIEDTADLKRNRTTLKSRNFSGNPLSLLFPLSLEWPLMLQIFEGDVTPGSSSCSNMRCLFYGEVGEANLEPPFITADCQTLSHIFDRQIPRRLYQRMDNWCLFEPANGLLPANWEWDAIVQAGGTAAIFSIGSITLGASNSNSVTLAAHYFAAGYLIITSAATGKQQVRMIADNTSVALGVMTLYVATPLAAAPAAGDTIVMYPGYDGQASTAQPYNATTNPNGKFSFYQTKFGGFPFVPVGNPSVLRITQPTGGGKK